MFGRSRNTGYGSYRGRKSGTSSVLKALIVILVILVAGVAALIYFIQPYLVYGKDGVTLLTPWSHDEDSSESSQPSESADAASTTPDASPSMSLVIDDQEAGQSEEPTPEVPTMLHAVPVDDVAILSGSAATQAASANGNAVIVTMKNDDGTLNYVSSVPLAVSAEATGSDTAVNAALKTLTDGDVYTIAQVSCFRDQLLPGYDRNLAIRTTSGYRWTDINNSGVRWSSPANETVCQYLTDICVELAQMGFDEILLTNCGYPSGPKERLGWIRKNDAYPAGALDTILTPFLTRIKTALEPYETKLSVKALGSELTGETANTGLTLANVQAQCDHVWLDAEDVANYPDLSSMEQLVTLSSEPGVEAANWAIREDSQG